MSSHFCQKGGRRGADKVLAAATIQLKKVTRKTGRVIDVACGQYSSFLVTESGQVIGFGLNNCYQMGYHDREVRYAPEVIPIKDGDDNVKVKRISSGMHHTLFLSESGKFLCHIHFQSILPISIFIIQVTFILSDVVTTVVWELVKRMN